MVSVCVHTTIVRVDKEDESKPVELLVQMPDQCPQDVTEIVKETRTITTEEICALPMDEVEGPQAVHTEKPICISTPMGLDDGCAAFGTLSRVIASI
jgi:hypothetical protein